MSRLQRVIGTEIVDDIRLGHTWHEYWVLREFIYNEAPEWFVEIGVHEGGLAYLLLQQFTSDELGYVGVELDCNLVRPKVKDIIHKRAKSGLICDDCFGDHVTFVVSSMQRKIVYCDGGLKAKELKHFKNCCVPGDIILAHDFYDGTRIVRDVPVENISIEVTADDIVHMDEDERFERLDESIFKETRIIGWRKL